MLEHEIPDEIKQQYEQNTAPPIDQETHELSPEVIQHIMEKVQDIEKPGTAFHSLPSPLHLKSALKSGILGTSTKEWATRIKKRDPKTTWFNIIGRSEGLEEGKSPVTKSVEHGKTEMARGHFSGTRPYTIIFDLSRLQEVDSDFYEKVEKGTMPARSGYFPTSEGLSPTKKEYAAITNKGQMAQKGWQSKEDIKVDTSLGFATKSRIAPRLFQGLVTNPDSTTLINHKWVNLNDLPTDQREKESHILIQEALEAQMETYKNRPELLMPVYDMSGNLLWPKQMSYEEVKKFVTERGKIREE